MTADDIAEVRGANCAPLLTWPNFYMSALGQKRTFAPQNIMSALPSKADMCGATAYVCFGPVADIASFIRSPHQREQVLPAEW